MRRVSIVGPTIAAMIWFLKWFVWSVLGSFHPMVRLVCSRIVSSDGSSDLQNILSSDAFDLLKLHTLL
ncbi:hypothetical protein L6R29_16580 [Myxococcota bacterium]|nr:hypothetical protein [Myxococcota bacterium]